MIVLDASAILAAMLDEAGAAKVRDVIDDSVVCAVNVAEVMTKLVDKGYPEDLVRENYRALEIAVIDFDGRLAATAALLRARTRDRGLSLGDRACLAVAIRDRATAMTADRNWAGLELGCAIELIR